MNKSEQLLKMLEHPERYSEQQWQEILADDECRELYSLMAKTRSAFTAEQADERLTDEIINEQWQRLEAEYPTRAAIIPLWRKVAATVAIAITLFGIGYAAVTTGFFGLQKQSTEETTTLKPGTNEVTADEMPTAIEQPTDSLTTKAMTEPRLYDNVPLEQMMSELAAYYQVDVEYRSDDVRSLRLYYEWEPDYTLDMVVDMLSHFESLSISREGNKLIVESAQDGK